MTKTIAAESAIASRSSLIQPGIGKYRAVIIAIALFLVFDLGVLIFSFYVSADIDDQAVAINMAGRQRMLSQRMAKAVLNIAETERRDAAANQLALDELGNTYQLFDQTLQAFDLGGQTTGGNGRPLQLARVSTPVARQMISDAYAIWLPYREKLKSLLDADSASFQAALSDVEDYTAANNIRLLNIMNSFTSELAQVARKDTDRLRWIETIGVLLALVNFFVILFYFIRQLRKSDAELEQAKAETDEIMGTVNDGLFLLAPNFTIGTQYSRSLETIFDRQRLANENFLDLLRRIVPEKTLQTASDYLTLLFGDRVNEKLVTDLNPLSEVEVFLDQGQGDYQVKYLTFSFKRALVEGKISHLLVQVADVTKQVKLARELQSSQDKAQSQFDLLLKVLHVEPEQLVRFIDTTRVALNDINKTLEERTVSSDQNRAKLEPMFRQIHTVKGDAAALRLTIFEEQAHEFETLLSDLRDRRNLLGNDFLPLTVKLDEMIGQIDAVRQLLSRVGELKQLTEQRTVSEVNAGGTASTAASTESLIADLVDTLAAQTGKRVSIAQNGLHSIPEPHRKPVSNMLIQLVRNAVAHGIEAPSERQANGKEPVGLMQVAVNPSTDNGYEIVFKDDGRGLSEPLIRQAAINKGLHSESELAGWDRRKIMGLIFKPGFSTAEQTDHNAGHGVGMDVVATGVRQLKGRLRLKSQAGQFCEFRIWLPEPATSIVDTLEVA